MNNYLLVKIRKEMGAEKKEKTKLVNIECLLYLATDKGSSCFFCIFGAEQKSVQIQIYIINLFLSNGTNTIALLSGYNDHP